MLWCQSEISPPLPLTLSLTHFTIIFYPPLSPYCLSPSIVSVSNLALHLSPSIPLVHSGPPFQGFVWCFSPIPPSSSPPCLLSFFPPCLLNLLLGPHLSLSSFLFHSRLPASRTAFLRVMIEMFSLTTQRWSKLCLPVRERGRQRERESCC